MEEGAGSIQELTAEQRRAGGEAAWSALTRSSAGVKRPSCKEDINHAELGLTEPFTQTLRSRDGYSTLLERLFLPR